MNSKIIIDVRSSVDYAVLIVNNHKQWEYALLLIFFCAIEFIQNESTIIAVL